MKFKIFYSWQTDLPNNTNRSFIETELKKALKKIVKDETELEPVIDRDTMGLSGAPDIVDSIFKKIADSQIFLADISIINSTEGAKRKCPNPNVLVELGYAIGTLGWDSIILVFNNETGDINDLPFDIKGRRIISYKKSAVGLNLASKLEGAVNSIIAKYKSENKIFYGRGRPVLKDSWTKEIAEKIITELNKSVILKDGRNEVRFSVEENSFNTLSSHIYFIVPSKLNEIKAGVNNMDGGFELVFENIKLNDEAYLDTEFNLYGSINGLNGKIPIHVRIDGH